MLAASALRLAAVETLSPTAAHEPGGVFPTLAEHRVFDNRPVAVEDIEGVLAEDQPWAPCLTLQTEEVRAERQGETAGPGAQPRVVLMVIAELAVTSSDNEGTFADASASTDPTARLVLDALCAQVRKALTHSPAGSIFREVGFVLDVAIEPFSLPEYGIRWLRNTMRFTCRVKDDRFTDAPGLPEPCASLRLKLPPNSYSRAKLDELEGAFNATSRSALAGISIATGVSGASGPDASI